ncbi:hypothetical protein [Bradyrhizobium sp. SZCCHNS1054]|uniref:hypothetical protein n=1 Tax=Bradyrhizobium sp. SZCCHNS1054 TaxID=3057301 RepID=UPI0029171422|nr:hypothetical protein [Bradyrhizobium sp. SZCCHNS1054]
MDNSSAYSKEKVQIVLGIPSRRRRDILAALAHLPSLLQGATSRLVVVLIALLILYMRMPSDFANPQFWGEDGPILYQQAFDHGLRSIFAPAAGYFILLQRLMAIGASVFPPSIAPTIMGYGAYALTLLVVWMATSPRFDVPFRPLIALAIVLVPMGYEILGSAANTQWIAPIGSFIILFLRPSSSKLVLLGESLFLAVIAFTGPCSLFLTPLCLVLAFFERDAATRNRLLAFAAILAAASSIVAIHIFLHRQEALTAPVPPIVMSWDLWIKIPLAKTTASFGPWITDLFVGDRGGIFASMAVGLITLIAVREPRRSLKLSMLYFGTIVMMSGIAKYRASLYLVAASGSTRYFYSASVLLLWLLCCTGRTRASRIVCASIVAAAEITSLVITSDTPRSRLDFEWYAWTKYIRSGLALNIPITPKGWIIPIPPHDGPMSEFNRWIGEPLATRLERPVDDHCVGSFDIAEPFNGVLDNTGLWIMKGTAWNTESDRPFELIAIVDKNDRIVGFGLPGFHSSDPHQNSGWTGIFLASESPFLKAYGLRDHGRGACMLAQLIPPMEPTDLTKGVFIGGTPLVAGASVVQQFKPARPIIEEISVPVVDWGKTQSAYTVGWRVNATSNGVRTAIGQGEIATQDLKDWQIVKLPTPQGASVTADLIEVEFSVAADQVTPNPIGLPLLKPTAEKKLIPVKVVGAPSAEDAVVALRLRYRR